MHTTFQIGIEMEVLLTHRRKTTDEFEDLEAFANTLVADLKMVHSRASRRPQPLVHNDVDGVYEGEEGNEWSITDDVTIKPDDNDQCMPQCSPVLY